MNLLSIMRGNEFEFMRDDEIEDDLELDEITIHSEEVDKPNAGLPYKAPVEIIIDARAWTLVNQYAREDLHKESGGVLLGNIYEHEGNIAVRISMVVPARQAIRNVTSITFTYEAWRQMEEERRQRAPTEKLVGWYHTHPGFGSTFSGFDYFLHESFFTQPWHIALLIDPVHNTHRWYRWEGGKLVTCSEYLLQICEQTDLNSSPEVSMNSILEYHANMIREREEREKQAIEPLLRTLASRISTGTSFEQLLSFIAACSELDDDILANIRQVSRKKPVADTSIHLKDVTLLTNKKKASMCNIRQGWLLELSSKELHVHELHAGGSFCRIMPLLFECLDVTLDEKGHIFLLSRSDEHFIHVIHPPLPSWEEHFVHTSKLNMTYSAMHIDWKDESPARNVGKILTGYRYLYLLTRTSIYTLYGSERKHAGHFVFFAKHEAEECGWTSFETLADWEIDIAGNLYLLKGDTKEVWQFNQLRGEKGIWERILQDERLEQPVSLAIGQNTCYIYDYEAGKIVEYDLATQRLIRHHNLAQEVQKLQIRQIFSDAGEGLYAVAQKGIYSLP